MRNQKRTKQYSILLIEDDILNQTIIDHSLKNHGFHIDIASNGLEGIKMFREKVYDFILMDMVMPGMDGIETTRAIRSIGINPHIPIIVLTADSSIYSKKKCRDYDVDACLLKPFSVKNLFDVLEKLNI